MADGLQVVCECLFLSARGDTYGPSRQGRRQPSHTFLFTLGLGSDKTATAPQINHNLPSIYSLLPYYADKSLTIV